jgi:hypothetical protein
MKNIKPFDEFESTDFQTEETIRVHEGNEGREMQNYMFFQNLHTLKNAVEELLQLDPNKVDEILSDGHGWALDHIATSVDDVEEVYHFLDNSVEMGQMDSDQEMSMGQDGEDGEEVSLEIIPEPEGESDEDDDEDDE